MKPTEILRSEHRVIEQVLNCLEAMGAEAATSGRLDAASARSAIDFFRHFADGCHHRKEEDALFPAIEARGLDAGHGPTAVMRHEHELGRAAIQGMERNVEQAALGQAEALASFLRNARSYVDLLRAHIVKEDHRLFPLAEAVLSEEAMAGVLDRFESVEHDDMGTGAHERYLALADELAEKFGVPRSGGAACTTCGLAASR
jgi:hemerythrin-like domain-containing protein